MLGKVRQLEKVRLQPVQVESVTADAATVRVQVRNSSKFYSGASVRHALPASGIGV